MLALFKMKRAADRKKVQGVLGFKSWGGARQGAGRPAAKGKRRLAHRKRDRLRAYEPQHTTLRLADDVARVRTWRVFVEIVSAIGKAQRGTFRVVEFSVQEGHLHLITEADGWKKLSDGVRGLEVRIARAINRVLGRAGRVFADRYHARALGTPREVRNALVYVLQNARKHFAQRGVVLRRDWLDRFSSAPFFAGWDGAAAVAAEALRAGLKAGGAPLADPREAPHTWLLRAGWKRHGLLRSTEVPATA